MVGISQDDARIKIAGLELLKSNSLYRARSTDWHEDGRLDLAAPRGQNSGPGLALLSDYLKFEWMAHAIKTVQVSAGISSAYQLRLRAMDLRDLDLCRSMILIGDAKKSKCSRIRFSK